MLRLFGLLIGLGWVFVGWRNLPPMSAPSAMTAGFAIGVTCWISYLIGRSATRAQATAMAMAAAEARAAARSSSNATAGAVGNVFVLGSPDAGARVAAGDLAALDNAPWIGEPKVMVEQDVMESIAEDLGMHEDYDYERG